MATNKYDTRTTAFRDATKQSDWEPEPQFEFGLPSEFWAHFVEHYWGKGPCILKGILDAPPITTEHVFRGLVAVSEQYRAGKATENIRFYVEHALQVADVAKYLPKEGDRSIEGYAERIKQKLEGRVFGLFVNGFHKYEPALYMRLRNFLRGLYAFVDFPSSLFDVALFLGNYKQTPFGLHYDFPGSNNFTFVLAGRKRLLAWPWEFFKDDQNRTHSVDYEAYRPHAVVLEGVPGDLICLPGDCWHIAESCDSFPVTLAVSDGVPQTAPTDPFHQVGRFLDERLRTSEGVKYYSCNLRDRRVNANKLPPLVARTARVLRELSHDKKLEQMLRVSWLNRISGFGFLCVPPPLACKPLADHFVVRVDPRYPIVWSRAEDGEITCSANGHAFSLAAHPCILKMLERLNTGEACRVGELVKQYKGTAKANHVTFEATPKDIRAILEKLYSLRALLPLHS